MRMHGDFWYVVKAAERRSSAFYQFFPKFFPFLLVYKKIATWNVFSDIDDVIQMSRDPRAWRHTKYVRTQKFPDFLKIEPIGDFQLLMRVWTALFFYRSEIYGYTDSKPQK